MNSTITGIDAQKRKHARGSLHALKRKELPQERVKKIPVAPPSPPPQNIAQTPAILFLKQVRSTQIMKTEKLTSCVLINVFVPWFGLFIYIV